MTNQEFSDREFARAWRLLAFVKDELRNMQIHARLGFIEALAEYLKPEIEGIARKKEGS